MNNEEKLKQLNKSLLRLEESVNRKTTFITLIIIVLCISISMFILLLLNDYKIDDSFTTAALIIVAINVLAIQRIVSVIVNIFLLNKNSAIRDKINEEINELTLQIIKDKLQFSNNISQRLTDNNELSEKENGKLYAIYLKLNSNPEKSKEFFMSNLDVLAEYLSLEQNTILNVNEHVYDSDTLEVEFNDNTTEIIEFNRNDVVNLIKKLIKLNRFL